jgi:hypothetical protein
MQQRRLPDASCPTFSHCCCCCRLLCMQVLLNVAKEAPGCFLPHLQSLVQQVEQLWAAGQLREGEKVSMIPASSPLLGTRLACKVIGSSNRKFQTSNVL